MAMSKATLTFTLWLTAAVLSFAAALIRYMNNGEVRWPLLAAGLFLLVAAVGTRQRRA
jgi:hypothetical protein